MIGRQVLGTEAKASVCFYNLYIFIFYKQI